MIVRFEYQFWRVSRSGGEGPSFSRLPTCMPMEPFKHAPSSAAGLLAVSFVPQHHCQAVVDAVELVRFALDGSRAFEHLVDRIRHNHGNQGGRE